MLENREGHKVPQVTFRTRRDHEWVDVSSDELFEGKTVVVFSLPGAFTPTCSATHTPSMSSWRRPTTAPRGRRSRTLCRP